VWTAARRVHHDLQDDDTCALCSQATETSAYLLASCVYTRESWFLILRRLGLRAVIPTADVVDMVDWWLPSRKRDCQRIAAGDSTRCLCWAHGCSGSRELHASLVALHPDSGRATCSANFKRRRRHGRLRASSFSRMWFSSVVIPPW
jgi:hypothetical protein